MRLMCTVFAAFTVLLLRSHCVLAQGSGGIEMPQTGVVLVKLSPPIYMPLAKQARISGDVKIQLAIRRDGSVAAADVVSGHPMLKPGALESAQKSIFECRDCLQDLNPYMLTYTFSLREDGGGCGPVEIDKEWHVRSSKCLYFWRCKAVRTFKYAHPNTTVEVRQSQNHVTVIASPPCVETEASQTEASLTWTRAR